MNKETEKNEFKLTRNLLYENCSSRIRTRINTLGLTQADIYPADPKMISRILNLKITTRNSYLIQYSVLCSIVENLNFKDNQEVIWGTIDEIKFDLSNIFEAIIFDLLSSKDPIRNEIIDILCSYTPFARYSAYQELFFYPKNDKNDNNKTEKSKISNAHIIPHLYGTNTFDLFRTTEGVVSKAITFLFLRCYSQFFTCYKEFTEQHDTFSKWPTYMMQWAKTSLLNILKPFAPSDNSIERRIINLIISDYSNVIEESKYLSEENPKIKYLKDVTNLTENYVDNLEALQKSITNLETLREKYEQFLLSEIVV